MPTRMPASLGTQVLAQSVPYRDARRTDRSQRRAPRRLFSLLFVERLVEWDQALLQAEDGGLGAVGEVQLGQDAGDVGLDGLLADRQGPSDLAVGAAVGQGGQDLPLARGQVVQWPATDRGLADLADQPGGDPGLQHALATGGGPHRGDDLVDAGGLGQVGERAGADRGQKVLVVLRGGEHEHLGGGPVLLDPREHADAVQSRHEQVQQHHGRLQGAHRLDRAGAVGAFADHLDAVLLLEQEAQALADHLVVVDDQHPDHGRPAGSSIRTLVPWPGSESSWNVPPSSATRSRISCRPRPWRRSARATSKPPPSSLTVTATWPSWWRTRIRMRVGWACLTALASATGRNSSSSASISFIVPVAVCSIVWIWGARGESAGSALRRPPASRRSEKRSWEMASCSSRAMRARSLASASWRSVAMAASSRWAMRLRLPSSWATSSPPATARRCR